ncbi:MAG: hypothetical protein WCB93_07560 [Gallionella sp.]
MANLQRKFVGLRGLLPAPVWCTTLLFPLSVLGADPAAEQPQSTGIFASMDAPRDYLSGKIIGFATDMDRFFGNDRNYQETNKSVVQLDLARATGYGGDRKLVLSARANLNLPSTEKRLHLLIESNPDQNISGEPTTTQNTAINNQVSGPQSYGLALRYEKVKEELRALHVSADAGLKFQGIHVDPFMRARTSYSVPFDTWRMKAAESVYWFNTIGLGETTQVDFEHVVSEPVLFRATSNATWLKDKQNFDLRQDFSLYQTLNERTALLYQASAIGVSNPQVELTEYIAQILYRYRLHRQWVFFELNPQLVFPKVNNFRSSFALTMRLEMLFDQSR